MEDQVELIKKLKKIARFNGYSVSDLSEWLELSKNYFYRASVDDLELDHEMLNKIREKIELFYKSGLFKLFDRPRQRIDYDLLHEIDNDYLTNKGSWDLKAYDDPRLKYVLYYEDVAND